MGVVKQIDIKNRTYYFYNDMINITKFDSNLLKIDKKSYKDIGICNIGLLQLKTLMIMKIFIVYILCIKLLISQVDTLKKNK